MPNDLERLAADARKALTLGLPLDVTRFVTIADDGVSICCCGVGAAWLTCNPDKKLPVGADCLAWAATEYELSEPCLRGFVDGFDGWKDLSKEEDYLAGHGAGKSLFQELTKK